MNLSNLNPANPFELRDAGGNLLSTTNQLHVGDVVYKLIASQLVAVKITSKNPFSFRTGA